MGEFLIDASRETAKLTVKFNNKFPVDLVDYSNAMIGLGNEYSAFICESDIHLQPEDIKLFVNHITTGSIIIELMALAPSLIPFVEHANTVFDFVKNVKENIEYLKKSNLIEDNSKKLDTQSLNRYIKLVEPVVKDNGSILHIDASNNSGAIHIHLNNKDARIVKENANKILDKMKEPIIGLHKNVILYWVQARMDNKKGDKAVIESISEKEVKVIFEDENIKHQILHAQPHPFNYSYLVDVNVETVKGNPALYKVLNFHEVIEIES